MEDFFAVEEDEKPKLKMPLFSLKKKEEINDVADVFSMDNEEDKKDKPKMPLFSKNSPKREEISEKQDVEQEDEMDVYFKSLNDQIQKEDEERKAYKKQDIYEEDDYLDSLNDKKSNQDHKEDDQDYDSDELANKENFDLPPLDHDKISYEKFQRNFYKVHPDIEKKNPEETKVMRKQLDIRVMGDGEIPCPVETFEQMNLHSKIYDTIKKEGFVDPTPIQRQSIPVAMTGRNCICISKTGSGKTAAFLIPMIHHILGQRPLNKGEGPIAVIVATSRELAKQIYKETKKFTKKFKFGVCALFGGVDQKEQILLLKRGCEVVVSTPGRLVHFMRKKYFKPFRISYLVLDEADRMFDMGFEPQVRSIVGQIRPDRQTLLFSATFKKPVEGLARDILKDPVRINVGAIGAANLDVQQMPVILPNDDQKWIWLLSNVDNLVSQGNLLIFVTQKDKCDFICSNLVKAGFHAASLHGDKSQQERQKIMFAFTNSNIKILVATDVIARGMDIKEVNNVICYDVPRNLESHTHRIGRTGRAGKKGVAWSLISQKDFMFASFLVRSLEGTNQNVPEDLMNIALKDQKFVKSHNNAQRNSGLGFSSNNNNNKKRKQDTDDQYENPTRFSLTESDLEKSKQYSVDLKTNSLNSNFVKSSSSYNTVKAKQPVQQVPPKPILISNLSNSFVKSKKPEDDNVPYDPSQPTSNTSSSAPKRNRWDQK